MDIPAGWKLVPLVRFVVMHSPAPPNYPYKIVDTFDGQIVDGFMSEGRAKSDAEGMNLGGVYILDK